MANDNLLSHVFKFQAFRLCQLRSQNMHNLSYEERIELWNLENEQFEELIIQPALSYYDRYFQRAPARTDGGLGWRNIWHQLQQDDAACLQLLRMSFAAFTTLCATLHTNYGLQPTLNISIEESVAMFLRICGHNEVQRDVGLRFGRNQETVKRKFGEVLTATELLACDYIRTPTTQELHRILERLQVDRRYWPYFNGFVGAMDGTHVCVKVKPELQGVYWNRHDNASLNILAICDLNMLFTYIWNGAPGSCHDTAVLAMAQRSDSEFPLPPSEKYYVVDSGYPNKQGFLAPYRSSRNSVVRYHMSSFHSGPPPRNKMEMFNRCHASLRSIIERTFGVWKKKWRILTDFPRYSIHVQKRVVMATMGLHNFIKISNFSDADLQK
ncbi:putative nuclease HARBI1 [Arabidopsis lyrata subsp. lyrata]|uniref:putative nuclease HARBI1 n=1 Tax=Arabidopsis lyrata subsp. lyrata TaxID=81972 RepID=UPI000A29D30A|nr:putative nuclease HARBI1 [Arabidopsis lyrata subsp. lyrata]|eukprot:XP_020872958.1 putative nuclease HARBI1 [Arabidopsis lyrata subsp. lyrata]